MLLHKASRCGPLRTALGRRTETRCCKHAAKQQVCAVTGRSAALDHGPLPADVNRASATLQRTLAQDGRLEGRGSGGGSSGGGSSSGLLAAAVHAAGRQGRAVTALGTTARTPQPGRQMQLSAPAAWCETC